MTAPIDPFRDETEPGEAEVARVVARARQGTRRRVRSRLAWLLAGALAVGALSVARLATLPPVEARYDGPVDARTRGGAHLYGEGRVNVVRSEVEVLSGALQVSGGDFVLRTREAEVRGQDADVRLQRDSLGTRVVVTRGVVQVKCGNTAPVDLEREGTCEPVSSEGMLARAAALRDAGRDPIAALDAAVTMASTPTAKAEALFQRGLARLAEPSSALADLEASEATGAEVRLDDTRRALARLYVAGSRCDAALPRLRALSDRGVIGEDRALLDACLSKAALP